MTDPIVQHSHTDLFFNSFDSDPLIKGKKILDVGCGDGYAALQFHNRGAALVHAMDPYLEGKPVFLEEAPEIKFFDYFPRGFDGATNYDIIWHHHVIEHVENCFEFLRIIRSMLTDDGWMWMACPNMAQHAIYSPDHVHNFQAAQLMEVLRRCHFAVGQAKIWVVNGQLRVRVPANGNHDYPEPMEVSLRETGRCPSELLNNWNWGFKPDPVAGSPSSVQPLERSRLMEEDGTSAPQAP